MSDVTPAPTRTVAEWLSYIESLHPKAIAMGLERVQAVAKRLQLRYPFTVITVGGTNGKGSTCAMLEQVYRHAGYQVGCYTSPHLVRYHERVRFNGAQISDELLCAAFDAVEQARQETPLTYFEMGTLAALWAFEQQLLDVVVLEVGLGGRLDAVNIVDADCAIVTNVDLDHMEFLGDTRELIGQEKAGIYRAEQIALCGDLNPPATLLAYAQRIGVKLHRLGVDYHISAPDTSQQTPSAALNNQAHYTDIHGTLNIASLRLYGQYQWHNAANVMFAVRALSDKLPVTQSQLLQAITDTEVIGRFQYLQQHPDVILDVAHNPHAARALRDNLERLMQPHSQVIAVFSMLADKDIASVVEILHPVINRWHIAPIEHPRAVDMANLQACVQQHVADTQITCHDSLVAAMRVAYKNAANNDKIIVFGSFFTVAAILALTPDDWQADVGRESR